MTWSEAAGTTTKVVAEYGQTHRGSPETAIEQAQVAVDAGCAYVKWQFLVPANLASGHAKAYWAHAKPGQLQIQTFAENRTLAYGAWGDIKAACDDFNIGFLATPFDLDAVDALEELDVTAYKIASGDITYRRLLERVAATNKPVFLSTGAANETEIARALDWLGGKVTLLACALVYPCPPAWANLSRITTLRHFVDGGWATGIGYSDHTTETSTGLAAAALGATVLEKHCTLDVNGPTPDDQMALDPGGLQDYVELAQFGATLAGNSALSPSPAEAPARFGARRSWHAAVELQPGAVLSSDSNCIALRPAYEDALSAAWIPDGLVVAHAVQAGEPIHLKDVDLNSVRSV